MPTVVHWEDRATEWSGRPDRIEIEVRTLEVQSGEMLALGSVKGKSKWAALGGDAPEDLLAVPLGIYVDWLFSPIGTPLLLLQNEAHNQPAQSPKTTHQ